jgi:hypothetical protein
MVLTSTTQYTPVVYWVVYQPSLQKAGQMPMLSAGDHTSLRCVFNDVVPLGFFYVADLKCWANNTWTATRMEN